MRYHNCAISANIIEDDKNQVKSIFIQKYLIVSISISISIEMHLNKKFTIYTFNIRLVNPIHTNINSIHFQIKYIPARDDTSPIMLVFFRSRVTILLLKSLCESVASRKYLTIVNFLLFFSSSVESFV